MRNKWWVTELKKMRACSGGLTTARRHETLDSAIKFAPEGDLKWLCRRLLGCWDNMPAMMICYIRQHPSILGTVLRDRRELRLAKARLAKAAKVNKKKPKTRNRR